MATNATKKAYVRMVTYINNRGGIYLSSIMETHYYHPDKSQAWLDSELEHMTSIKREKIERMFNLLKEACEKRREQGLHVPSDEELLKEVIKIYG